MPWIVAAIGVIAFVAGLETGNGRWVEASFLIATSAALGLVLRHYVESTIDQAFEKGAGYGISTRRRIRELPEASDVSAAAREKWLT